LPIPEFVDRVTAEQDETGDDKSAQELGDNDKVQQPPPPAVAAHQNEQGDGKGDAAKDNGQEAKGTDDPGNLNGLLDLLWREVIDMATVA
jgi:hypothetical protein